MPVHAHLPLQDEGDTDINPDKNEVQAEVLDLDFGVTKHVAPRRQNIMNRTIKHVCLIFENDEKLEYDLDDQQGFYRETLTFEEATDGSRIQNRLRIYNVFWAVKEIV